MHRIFIQEFRHLAERWLHKQRFVVKPPQQLLEIRAVATCCHVDENA
jgi:hypothetical protein